MRDDRGIEERLRAILQQEAEDVASATAEKGDLREARDATGSGQRPPIPPGLNTGGSGGNFGDMEARVAKLEAHVEHIRAELSKLAGLPAEAATIKERLTHLPTKTDVKIDIEGAIDRAASRTQRTIAVASGAVTIAVAAINYLPKLLGH